MFHINSELDAAGAKADFWPYWVLAKACHAQPLRHLGIVKILTNPAWWWTPRTVFAIFRIEA